MMKTAFISALPINHNTFTPCQSPSTSTTNLKGLRRHPIYSPSTSARGRSVWKPSVASIQNNDNKQRQRSLIKLPTINIDLQSVWDTTQKALAVVAVAFALVIVTPDASDAARGGGRVGGSQFRSAPSASPRSSYSSPSPSYGGGYGGGYGYGYGGPGLFLNPFVAVPFGGFGLGFGGIGTLLALAAVTSFISDTVRQSSENDNSSMSSSSSTMTTRNTVVNLKIGLLSNARTLQVDLDAMARSADTSTTSGLTYVLQSVLTSLLRHPDYWAYGSTCIISVKQSNAESEFNKIILEERLKLKEETLSNTQGNKFESGIASDSQQDTSQAPGEYIIVNVIVAVADGKLITQLPKNVDQVADVDKALKALSSVTKDSIQAVEIIWAPQSLRDTLTEREMLEDHPELKRL